MRDKLDFPVRALQTRGINAISPLGIVRRRPPSEVHRTLAHFHLLPGDVTEDLKVNDVTYSLYRRDRDRESALRGRLIFDAVEAVMQDGYPGFETAPSYATLEPAEQRARLQRVIRMATTEWREELKRKIADGEVQVAERPPSWAR
jgi:hypothetical protein